MDIHEARRQVRRGAPTPEAVWLTVLVATARKRWVSRTALTQAVGVDLMGLQGAQSTRWLPSNTLPDRREFLQDFVLPSHPIWRYHALTLSAFFGIRSGRLWLCRKCQRPFVRHEQRPRQIRCDDCLKVRITAAGLPGSIKPIYQAARKRRTLRVHRGTLPSEQRDREQAAALRDARLYQQGKLTLAEWRERHDRKDRPGPKPSARRASQPLAG